MFVTLKELANQLGLSVATVSKVINGKGTVSAETREKVLSLAKQVNYRPNESARSLRTKNTKTIGVIIPDITNSFYTRLIKGIEERCQSVGYSVILSICNYNSNREYDYVELLCSKNVNGIISATLNEMSNFAEKFRTVLISINEQFPDVSRNWVSVDNKAAMYDLTQHVINLGHTKIACIYGTQLVTAPKLRLEGFLQCMKDNSLSINEKYLLDGGLDYDTGREAAKSLIKGPLPTAVICHNSVLSYALYDVLCEAGYNVPDDISIAGFDIHEFDLPLKLSFTCIRQPVEQIGNDAVNLILQKMDLKNPISELIPIIEPHELVWGNTVKNIK